MKKSIIFCATLLVGAIAFAQPSDKFTGSLLWKISGNGLAEPSHILALYSFDHERPLNKVAGASKALKASSQLVVELPDAQMDEFDEHLKSISNMPAGVTYEALLSKEDYARVDDMLKYTFRRGLDQFGSTRPGLLLMQLSLVNTLNNLPGFDPRTHISKESAVEEIAARRRMPVIGLETPRDQVRAQFDHGSLAMQAERLACCVRNFDHTLRSIKTMISCYTAADLAGMHRATFGEDAPCSAQGEGAMIAERNDRWAAKLPSIMSEAPAFIAVSAINLPGDEGLLARLEKMGYTVEPVVK